jgi:ABC-type dipeptide/oligopeptide/nickel transport system permease subunit
MVRACRCWSAPPQWRCRRSIGVLYGAVAGFAGGVVDNLMMRFVDAMLSFPTFFLLLIISALTNQFSLADHHPDHRLDRRGPASRDSFVPKCSRCASATSWKRRARSAPRRRGSCCGT